MDRNEFVGVILIIRTMINETVFDKNILDSFAIAELGHIVFEFVRQFLDEWLMYFMAQKLKAVISCC